VDKFLNLDFTGELTALAPTS